MLNIQDYRATRRWVAVTLLVMALPLLLGCGRQGSVTSAQSTRRQTKTTPVIGDKAEYTIVSSVRTLINKSPMEVTGHRKCIVTKSVNHGRSLPPHIVNTFDFRADTVQGVGTVSKSRTFITWFGMDASGNLYILGESEDGSTWDVVTDANPPMYMPSQLEAGSTWSYVAHLASGATESMTMKCVGMEKIRTPTGDVDAYKLTTSIVRKGISMTGLIWLSPNAPFVFELALEVDANGRVQGFPSNVRMGYQLRNLSLVQ